VMASDPALDQKKMMHAVVEWKGKHEWPDSLTFEDAFYWNEFNLMRNKIIPLNNDLIKTFLQKKNKNIAGKNILVQFNIYKEIISFLQSIGDASPYEKKLAAL